MGTAYQATGRLVWLQSHLRFLRQRSAFEVVFFVIISAICVIKISKRVQNSVHSAVNNRSHRCEQSFIAL